MSTGLFDDWQFGVGLLFSTALFDKRNMETALSLKSYKLNTARGCQTPPEFTVSPFQIFTLISGIFSSLYPSLYDSFVVMPFLCQNLTKQHQHNQNFIFINVFTTPTSHNVLHVSAYRQTNTNDSTVCLWKKRPTDQLLRLYFKKKNTRTAVNWPQTLCHCRTEHGSTVRHTQWLFLSSPHLPRPPPQSVLQIHGHAPIDNHLCFQYYPNLINSPLCVSCTHTL